MLADVLVIPHTHWDREWYHSVDGFRLRLVQLIDELIDDPPPHGESFLLDGQAVLLDDYLTVRPERTAELSALLRDGRLEAGPWYVLADELIPSGEALVRNLLLGRDTVRRLRGDVPDVLYCPDSFGHPAALPSIASGFGCRVVLLWRGLGGGRTPDADTLRWRSSDGSEVIVYHLPPDGYEFGSSLPIDATDAVSRWERVEPVLTLRSNSGLALLLNGADHHARQRGLHESLAVLRAVAAPTRVRSSSLKAAADELVARAQRVELPQITGELRDSYGYTWTLGGTLATRAHQKRANARAERLLVRDVEPWIALLPNGAAAQARALLHSAWRTLLAAHPHDTLCGTSVDAVANAFDIRVMSAMEQGTVLRTSALNGLIGHDAEAARTSQESWQPAVTIRNAVPRVRGGIVELSLRAKLADIAVGPGSASRQGVRQRPEAFRVDGVRVQILERKECVELTESPRAYPDADCVVEARAVGWMEPMAGFTVATRLQRARSLPTIQNPVVATATSLDNGRVRIQVAEDGRVSFKDLARNRVIDDLISFERAADVGDLYTPAIRDALPPPTFVRCRLVHRGPIRGALALEYRIGGARARAGGSCRVTIELDADATASRMVVEGENREMDHRLRLRIATGLADAHTIADAAFGPVARELLRITATDAQMEHLIPTAPLHRWVARFGSESGAVLVSDGLPEYESIDDGTVAVTLVRSVGELSRHDLPERPGHAGWPAPVPGAQCIGPYAARFALRFCDADSISARDAIEQFADDVLVPLEGETLRSNLRDGVSAGGLTLTGEGLAFSGALPSREEGWITLRCVNLNDAVVSGRWHLARGISEAKRARLDETATEDLIVTADDVAFQAGPREIVTILVR